MIDHEGILRKAAAEIRAANINGWGNACEGGADRIRALESAMRKIVRDGDYTAPEGMKRIAQEALGSELETASKPPVEMTGWCAECGCGKNDPDGSVIFAHMPQCSKANRGTVK